MHESIENLLDLQEIDRKLLRLKRESKDIPERKVELAKELESSQDDLEATREDAKQNRVAIDELELKTESLREQIEKYKRQRMEVKTNQEYKALNHEIEELENKISALEDSELELMEQAEEIADRLQECHDKLEKEKRRILAEQEGLDGRKENNDKKMERLNSERTEIAQNVEDSILKRYEKIFNNKLDYAIVPLEKGHCGGCHMKLTSQMKNDVQGGSKLISCNYCARLLTSSDKK